jgi:hypothetical protein
MTSSLRRVVPVALLLTAFFLSARPAAQGLPGPVDFVSPPGSKKLGRIDATVRRAANGSLELMAMTPKNDDALTSTGQPTLYWFLSGETDRSAVFSLREQGSRSPKPTFECRVQGPIRAGAHRIALSDLGVSLKSQTDYRWSIKLQDESSVLNNDAGVVAFIVVPDLEAVKKSRNELMGKSIEEQYKWFAGHSFWYDALSTIAGLWDSVPLSRDYRDRYIELLRRGGLDTIASHRTVETRTTSRCAASLR